MKQEEKSANRSKRTRATATIQDRQREHDLSLRGEIRAGVQIVLKPLVLEDLERLIADSIHAGPDENHSGRLWVTANDGPGVTFQFPLLSTDAAADP